MNPADHWTTFVRRSPLGLLTDLDGTVIPFAASLDDARLVPEVQSLLRDLAALPDVVVTVVSGRPRESLAQLLGDVPGLQLAAEHGGWLRGESGWRALVSEGPAALDSLTADLEGIARHHAPAYVERKTWSACLHFRGVQEWDRPRLFVEANVAIATWLRVHPGYERLEAIEALEIRLSRIRKSLAVSWTRARAGPGATLLVLGDDVTDEDMFRALAAGDEAVLVGPRSRAATAARWALSGPDATLTFLRWIAAARRGDSPPRPEALPEAIGAAPRSARPAYRLLTISNRLPDLRSPVAPDPDRGRNVGGLVSALEPVLASRHGVWLGWSGRTVGTGEAGPVQIDDASAPPLAWMDFPEDWYELYYNGFCNRSLWPLFHAFPARVRFVDEEWHCYVKVNRAFASAARALVEPHVPVWVHDYHALLVAGELRRAGHRGPIGLFLHIPFPGIDLFSMLPWAATILEEMLQFDLLGFHTQSHIDNFFQCVRALLPVRVSDQAIIHQGRQVRVRALPIGIIPQGFQEPPEPKAAEEIAALLQSIAPSRLVLGVDRLDYTKGIPERLYAFGRLFELFPEWRGKVSLVQISVPSRADVPEYAEQRTLIENAVGRVNGEFGEAHWTPIRYLYRAYGRNQLAQLYRAADVGYVTPLRDGMNLVAKEYVAAQDPLAPGVLLLSRFAGAAAELGAAVLTNPYHRDGMARDLDRALRMPAEERGERHQRLYATISRSTAVTWAEEFLGALETGR